MFNLFKRILPILKNRLFGTGVSSGGQLVGTTIYCQTLYVVDTNLSNLNVTDSMTKSLNVVDNMSWSINDGCSRSS